MPATVLHGGVTVSLSLPRPDHRAEDGFRFLPRWPVDWLVYDMVERPHRIARLLTEWLSRGDCRHAIVNLKLPTKQRWQTVSSQLETIAAVCRATVYHDREEVTLFATRTPDAR